MAWPGVLEFGVVVAVCAKDAVGPSNNIAASSNTRPVW
jgi:hypothetical protein